MLARPPSSRQVDEAYRKALERLRTRIAATVSSTFTDGIDAGDIAGSYGRVTEQAADVVAAGQSVAQSLATAYLARLGAAIVDEDLAIVGTTRAGLSLEEGLAPFAPMMLAAIANGRLVEDAIAFGQTLVSGFADREVTAAADRETAHQVTADPGSWRWEGIVAPSSCDACKANEGIHDADVEIYRHNDCACTQRWIPASAAATT